MLIFTIFKFMFICALIVIYNLTSSEYIKNLFITCIKNNNIVLVKLMQWLSEKPQIIPRNIILLFDELKEDYPIHNFEYTLQLLKKYDVKYDSIEKIPIASGSIAQVYKGKKDGQDVAIKVSHPNLTANREEYKQILNGIMYLVNFIFKYFLNKNNYDTDYSIDKIFDLSAFYNGIYDQLDLRLESQNAKKFSDIFKKNKDIIIPEVLYESSEVIIYSYEESENFKEKIQSLKIDKATHLFSLLRVFIIKSIVNGGVYHGDMHISNWGIRDNSIVVYDFGYICEFNPECYVKFIKTSGVNDFLTLLYITLEKTKNQLNKFKNNNKIKLNDFVSDIFSSEIDLKRIFDMCTEICYTYNLNIDNAMLNILQVELVVNDIFFGYFAKKDIMYSDILNHYIKNHKDDIINKVLLETIVYNENTHNIKEDLVSILRDVYKIDDNKIATFLPSFMSIINILRINGIRDTNIIDFMRVIEDDEEKYSSKLLNIMNKFNNNFVNLIQAQIYVSEHINEPIDKLFEELCNVKSQ